MAEVSHANLAVIDYVNKSPYALYTGNQNLVDLSLAVGILNLSGNIFSPNGANLKVNKSAGSYFSIGANHSINPRNPNVLDRPQEITPLLYRFLRGGLTTVSTDIDPDFYDLNGVLTAMSNNHWQVQRFYMLGTLIGVAYGQVSYPNFADAFANYDKEIINGTQTDAFLLRAYLIVKKGATALNNSAQAVFHPAGKFGAGGSGGGSGGNGDVIGSASSTTNAIVRYADPSGKLIKNSSVTLDDAGDLTGLSIITPLASNLKLYGTLEMMFNKIIDLDIPAADYEAANKLYVDGKVTAPLTTVANTAIAVFNGTTGKIIKQSSILISDAGNLLPTTNLSSSLGATSQRFLNLYSDNILSASSVNMNGVMTITPSTITTTGNMVFNTGTLAMNGSTVNILNTGATTINPTGTLTLKACNLTGALAMGANKITGLGTPTDNTDATTKLYVDSSQSVKPTTEYTASTTGAVVICSVRKVKASYTGACCRIRRSSDSAEQDIYFDRFSLVDKTSFDTFVGGGTGFIKIMYDQSGNGYNYQQLETAKQPSLVFNGDIPEILFNTGDQNKHFDSAQTTATMGLNLGTYSQTTVFDTSAAGIQFPFSSNIGGNYECHLGASLTVIRLILSVTSIDFTVANWTTAGYHRLTMLCGAGNSNVRFDGTTNTPQTSTIDTNSTNLIWGIRGGDSFDFEGKMNELIVWNIVPSNSVLLAIETDQIALWTNSTKATTAASNSYYYNGKIINNKAVGSYTDSFELVSKGYVDRLVSTSYTVATLPSAVGIAGGIIYVSNEAGGATIAFSDGTNWRRVSDRAIVS